MSNNQNLSLVIVKGGHCIVNLFNLVNDKVHEYLMSNFKLIYSTVKTDVVVPSVGTFYSQGVETFIVNELVEAIVNIFCYNIVIRSKYREVTTLLHTTSNPELFISSLRFNYQADYRKLVDMLINNETQLLYRDAKSGRYADDQALMDYVDIFNGSVLKEIYAVITFLLRTAKTDVALCIAEIAEQIEEQTERLFYEGRIKDVLHPSSVFVTYKTFDIVIVNI